MQETIWHEDPENPRIVTAEDPNAREVPFIKYDLDKEVVFRVNTEQALAIIGYVQDEGLEFMLAMQFTHQKKLREQLGMPE